MARDFRTREWKEFYSTGKDNLADDFYGPAIARACLIERAVGFFRSTAYLLLYDEFCDFLRNNGRLKLICSPRMHKEDIKSIREVVLGTHSATSSNHAAELLNEIDALKETERGQLHVRLVAGMLKFDLLELKIALTSEGEGIFHEKIGILHDTDGHMLSFSGSANETLCGWGLHGNVESFDVFRSWEEREVSRVRNHRKAFLDAWEGKRSGVRTMDLEAAVKERLLQEAPEDKEELLRTAKTYQKLSKDILNRQRREPSPSEVEVDEWPTGRQAEPHQREALDSWYENNCRGIFKHATGSGKTFTGLHAIRDHVRQGKVALVIVPSELLFDAWRDELNHEMPGSTLLLVGSGNNGWKSPYRVEAFTAKTGTDTRHIILATMQTASTPKFYQRLKKTQDVLLIVDEVHQLGSPEYSKLMTKNFGKRLGLSATPERYGDFEGTERLLAYFGGVVGGEFTLPDAMRAGRLVPYEYQPVFVHLTEFERERWRDLTLRIRRAAASSPKDDSGTISPSLRLKKLLIERSRVAKKAHGKIEAATRILKEHFREDQHWLVYCEDQHQVSAVVESFLGEGLKPMIYHSSMGGDPKRTLSHYIRNGGIMVAIRCLDEGVDIPNISHAIILASSQNPRQFIQRRGRVLRVAPFKTMAYVWDALVLPLDEDQEDEDLQDSLTRAEILRALEFAGHAMNQQDASRLRMKAVELGLELSKVYPASEDTTEEDEV